jgi:hypothetical protein
MPGHLVAQLRRGPGGRAQAVAPDDQQPTPRLTVTHEPDIGRSLGLVQRVHVPIRGQRGLAMTAVFITVRAEASDASTKVAIGLRVPDPKDQAPGVPVCQQRRT